MGLTIAQLHLQPHVETAARRLVEAFPDVQFTSGRRDLMAQARAMTINLRSNPHWIGQTYRHGASLQAWVDRHIATMDWGELEQGLFEQLVAMPEAHRISRHLTGQAFDLQPMVDHDGLPTARGREVMDFIRRSLLPRQFLTSEGGLSRWHVEFDDAPTQTA